MVRRWIVRPVPWTLFDDVHFQRELIVWNIRLACCETFLQLSFSFPLAVLRLSFGFPAAFL